MDVVMGWFHDPDDIVHGNRDDLVWRTVSTRRAIFFIC